MARELQIDVEVNAMAAEVALGQLEADFRKLGYSVEEADKKAQAFERGMRETDAKKRYRDTLAEIRQESDRGSAATAQWTAAIMRFAGPAVVLAAAQKTIAWADNVQELAERTSLSVEYVQQLTKVAEKNGTTFQTMANLIQASEQRLATGNKKAIEAVEAMGLSVESLLAMNPEERFRALAKGIAGIEDPAQRSAAEMAIFGRSADGAAAALLKVAEGADKAESALGADFVNAGANAQDMLETLTNKALQLGQALLLLPAVIGEKVGQWGKDSTLGTWFESMGLHGGRATSAPGLPASPGAPFGMPSPLAVPGDPFAPGGVGGNSMEQVVRSLRPPKAPAPGRLPRAGLPFVAPGVDGATAARIWAMGNTPGGFLAGSLPFMSSPTTLTAGGSPLSFANGMQLPGGVTMNAPGAGGGGWFSNLFKGKGGSIAGLGMGLLSNLIPGLSRTGSSIGGTLGSVFGPLGSGIGSLAGGLFGKLFGGNSDSKQLKSLRSDEDFTSLVKAAQAAGISVEKLFSTKKVKDFEKAVADVSRQVTEAEQQTEKTRAAMERWGLSIEDMGQRFKQTEMDKVALSFAEDFVTLVEAGADVTTVIEKMGPAVNEFINKAIAMGIEVPRAMKPIIDKMREQGLLVDANGEAFTDQMYESIQWATTLTQGFDKVEAAINRLADAILGVGAGFDQATKAAADFNREVGSGDYGQPGTNSGETPGFAAGGVAGRDWRRPGVGDVIPALLKRGERVLPAGVSGGGVSLSGVTINVAPGTTTRQFADTVSQALVLSLERKGIRLVA